MKPKYRVLKKRCGPFGNQHVWFIIQKRMFFIYWDTDISFSKRNLALSACKHLNNIHIIIKTKIP